LWRMPGKNVKWLRNHRHLRNRYPVVVNYTICFYESSYIVQALVLSVFVLLCFCMFPCRFCLILLPLVVMLNVWSIWI
jgi:hypothetical protein